MLPPQKTRVIKGRAFKTAAFVFCRKQLICAQRTVFEAKLSLERKELNL